MGFGNRVYNFSAGPSMLPLEVLEKVRDDLLNYAGSGMSVMEMSHRSKIYDSIINEAEANLRELMGIPENYKVLFLQGGATLQFSMIPMNLLRNSRKADYVVTGTWAEKAAQEASKFGDVAITASSKDKLFTYVPKVSRADFRPDADYAYITMNNTIYGSRYSYVPDTGDVPLVCDWSSGILSEGIDVSRFGLIYAGAQKNIAPAGVTIVIIREDLVGHAPKGTPVYMDYRTHADNGSMYNTPPAFTIYVAGEVFKHLKAMGGVAAQERFNREKAGKLYGYIDGSRLYRAPVEKDSRSLMNVVFVTGDEALDKKFVAEAREEGLLDLNGHRSIGGMRASIYNAMPMEGVDRLIAFMERFEAANLK
ncbi:MAG: 3-phosphoserine/phosphohydroxythreonine transaminase [Clostridiales Family XIII bacterium]|jgi:phosphoserine aminotransferase|nr:3-phosphoserine/phosphohydroxythreonine transaminase [Clostridiales Family XIII bacterium]